MGMIDTFLKHIDIEKKLTEINKKLDLEYNTKTGILIFDNNVFIIDAEKSGEIEILKKIDFKEIIKTGI